MSNNKYLKKVERTAVARIRTMQIIYPDIPNIKPIPKIKREERMEESDRINDNVGSPNRTRKMTRKSFKRGLS